MVLYADIPIHIYLSYIPIHIRISLSVFRIPTSLQWFSFTIVIRYLNSISKILFLSLAQSENNVVTRRLIYINQTVPITDWSTRSSQKNRMHKRSLLTVVAGTQPWSFMVLVLPNRSPEPNDVECTLTTFEKYVLLPASHLPRSTPLIDWPPCNSIPIPIAENWQSIILCWVRPRFSTNLGLYIFDLGMTLLMVARSAVSLLCTSCCNYCLYSDNYSGI